MVINFFIVVRFFFRSIRKYGCINFCLLFQFLFFGNLKAGADDSITHKSFPNKVVDSSRAGIIKNMLSQYLMKDALSDSIFFWADSLSAIGGPHALENNMDAQIFKGKYFIRKAEFAKALEFFYTVLQIAQKNKQENYVAKANLQIGVVFYTQKQFTEAIENFVSSLHIYEKLGSDYQISMLNYLVGTTLCDLKKLNEAEAYLDKAIELKLKIGDTKGEYESKVAKAKLLYLENNFSAADKLYKECINYFIKSKDLDALTVANIGLARVFLKTNNSSGAEILLKEAFNIADSLHFEERKIDALKELKDYYISAKVYDKAVAYQSKYYQLKDSIFNFDNAKTIGILNAKIEAEKKQAEIEALQHKEKVAGIQRIFGIAVIFFLLAYLYNLYKRFSFQKKAEQALAKTNKDLENTIVNLKATEQELIHAEKMASMGRLTSGIAHELRNPLNFVANFSKLSEELVSEISNGLSDEERTEAARQLKNNLLLIQTHSNRADSIIRSMLQLSRKSSTERSPEFLNKLIEEFTKVAYKNFTDEHHSFTSNIEFDFDDRIQLVQMNSHEITGVILSLVHNAFDSMQEKKSENPDYHPELRIATKLDHDKAFVYVTDNGKGIPENVRQKIFEPFFSTKPIEKGTGLGLSLCYDFIKIHQGGITATSNQIQTTLTFFLPVNSSVGSANMDYSTITNYKN